MLIYFDIRRLLSYFSFQSLLGILKRRYFNILCHDKLTFDLRGKGAVVGLIDLLRY